MGFADLIKFGEGRRVEKKSIGVFFLFFAEKREKYRTVEFFEVVRHWGKIIFGKVVVASL